MNPTGDAGEKFAGPTRTTGRPCLVTMTSLPVAAMSSMSSRQVALKTLAEMCAATVGAEGAGGAESGGLDIRISLEGTKWS